MADRNKSTSAFKLISVLLRPWAGPCSQLGDGAGSYRDALDRAFIASSANSEVAVLPPAAAPAVLYDPVPLPSHGAAAVPHQQHRVVGQLEGVEGVCQACVVVDAPAVAHEVRVDLGGADITHHEGKVQSKVTSCLLSTILWHVR